jgi:CRP-like cAMP-binding protein
MKGILGLLRPSSAAPEGEQDSRLFATAFFDQGIDAEAVVPWDARAVEVGARRLAAARGVQLLEALWGRDRFMNRLSPEALAQLGKFFEFATIPAGRDVVRQDEHGDFMLVLLSGTVSVERHQPWGEQLRLAEAGPGDILGEMSLLDSGVRFSHCSTITDCEVAVLDAEALDNMLSQQPALAASLIGLLARKLSLRLRAVSARLGGASQPSHQPNKNA